MFGLSDSVVEDIRRVFKQHPNIRQVFIFGSRAKDTYHNGSG